MGKAFNRSGFIKSQGLAAEKIVINHFSSQGSKVEINPDEWGWWDLKVDGQTVQVKCLTPFMKHQAWSIYNSGRAIENLNRADRFMIISVPLKKGTEFDGWLLEVDRSKCSLGQLGDSIREGEAFVIPMSDSVAKRVYKLTAEEESAILKYSTSYLTKKWRA